MLFAAAASSSSGVILSLLQCGVSPTGNNHLRTTPVWALFTGCHPSRTSAPVWVPHRVTSPTSKTALPMVLQVLQGAFSSMELPWGHSFFRASTCYSILHFWVSYMVWRWISSCTSMFCMGIFYLTTVCTTDNLSSSSRSMLSPSCFIHLDAYKGFLSCASHSSLQLITFAQSAQ